MRNLLFLLCLTGTVFSEFYKPVLAPSSRIRHYAPLAVENRAKCQIICDCARQKAPECNSPLLGTVQADCRAYAYRDGLCVLLGETNPRSTCSVNNTEYVLIDDPCIGKKCGANGVCDVYDGWIGYCWCNEGFQGLECEEKIDSSQTGVSFENRTCYEYGTEKTVFGDNMKRQDFESAILTYDACYDFMKSKGGNMFAVKDPACLSLIRAEVKIVPLDVSAAACSKKCKSKPEQFCGATRGGWIVDPKENGAANPCDSSPCGDNGLCLRKKDGSECLCKLGFGGDTCKPNP